MGTIAVVDYGMGNLRSVAKALEHVAGSGQKVRVTDDAGVIDAAERVVFPGQGAARDCMRAIDAHGLREPLWQAAHTRPFLGMCMGLQVLLAYSEENEGTDCLGLFTGRVRYFGSLGRDAQGRPFKVPHMGWNAVEQTQAHPLWQGIADGTRFYFVHSYYAHPDRPELVAGATEHGLRFASAVASANVFACQFHPEKSSRDGLQLLANFVAWDGEGAPC
ncbi:MAG: imidazole glycerol phosphate synthase subunit HisH [Proteobacteria bacterium SW_6_67_9]|nr:MAG: imidazole glycerol phosphate synthase subunit HisH [Proteobacteria bacterium SW_6_67_9]